MLFHRSLFFVTMLAAGAPAFAQGRQPLTSLFSPVHGAACPERVVEKTTGATIAECPGVGGYRLRIGNDDERVSIAVVDRVGTEHALNLYEVVTPAMVSTIGRAEWRVSRQEGAVVPEALIIRLDALDQTDPERPKRKPLTAVAKITERETCVVAVLSASRGRTARQQADAAAKKPCLQG